MLKDNIKRIRENAGISQRELARRINMSGQMISKIERGDTTPSLETLDKIAEALKVTTNDLLAENETLSKQLINILKYLLAKIYGAADTLEVLSNKLKIDYNLLCDSINENVELPIDAQIELLDFLYKTDYYRFVKFISTNDDKLFENPELKNKILEISKTKTFQFKSTSFEMFYQYLIAIFGKEFIKFSSEDRLFQLQEEVNKFLEYSLFKMKKEYYDQDN